MSRVWSFKIFCYRTDFWFRGNDVAVESFNLEGHIKLALVPKSLTANTLMQVRISCNIHLFLISPLTRNSTAFFGGQLPCFMFSIFPQFAL
jgi:hypothetical protein